VQTFLPATQKTQREHCCTLRELIVELSDIARRLTKFACRKGRFYLWLAGYVIRVVFRMLRLRKIWAVTLYVLAGFGASFVLIVVSWHLDETTTAASNTVKPAVISSADTHKKNQSAQYANCSFGQIENFETGNCQWTSTWTHVGKEELYKDVADARLTLVSANLNQGRTELAAKALEPLLIDGNAEAQRIAALMYLNGYGVVKDLQKATELLELAANQSDPKAQYLLGDLLIDKCKKTCPAVKRALPLFHAAHKAGVSEATEALAKIHLMGIGVDRDPQTALPFIKAAAEAGKVRSQRILGLMFFDGDNVPESAELSVKWLEKAAMQGDEVAMGVVGVRYILGEGVSQDVDKGLGWLWLSANSQHPHAQFVVGEALYSGDFGPHHKLKGLMWLKIAERNGSKDAKNVLIDRQEMLSREEHLIADLMADDCLVDKKCGSPPWDWKRDEKETRL
jgi:TPR repeat protein